MNFENIVVRVKFNLAYNEEDKIKVLNIYNGANYWVKK